MTPYLISIPHGSKKLPDPVRRNMALTRRQIKEAVDLGSLQVFSGLSETMVQADYSRLLADLNRNPSDTGPKGVVARTDYHGRNVFQQGRYPDADQIQQIIKRYHQPYHARLGECFAKSGIRYLFDCHSLNGIGPKDAPDAGKKRKDIILSNNGDVHGNAILSRGELSCPTCDLTAFASFFSEAGFDVSLNHPYKGGYITRHFGQLFKNKHALQIEMNEDLVTVAGKAPPRVDPKRLTYVKDRIRSVFKRIAVYLS